MQLVDFMNLITDYILAAFTLYFGIKLYSLASKKKAQKWLSIAFFLVGISALFAGTWHGFHRVMPKSLSLFLWPFSMFFLFGFSFCLLIGTILLTTHSRGLKNLFFNLTGCKTVLFLYFYMLNRSSFSMPFYDYSLSFFCVFLLSLWQIFTKKVFAYLWIIIGICIAYFAGFLWMKEIPMYSGFNFNDLFHILQIGSAFCMYKGYKKILIASERT